MHENMHEFLSKACVPQLAQHYLSPNHCITGVLHHDLLVPRVPISNHVQANIIECSQLYPIVNRKHPTHCETLPDHPFALEFIIKLLKLQVTRDKDHDFYISRCAKKTPLF